MNGSNALAAEILEASATGYAAAANALLEREQSSAERRDAGAWQAHLKQRIFELAAAVRIGEPDVFARRVDWLLRAAQARGSEPAPIMAALRSLRESLSAELPENLRDAVVPYIEQALKQPEDVGDEAAPLLGPDDENARIVLSYLEACLAGNARQAAQQVLTEIENGLSPKRAYIEILIPAQKEIGNRWHLGKVTVAEERLVSETTRRVMSQISSHYAPLEPTGPTMLAASVAGNAHDIGLRIVSDLFLLAGWRCLFLGANVPIVDTATAVRDYEAALVVLTATLATQLNTLTGTIDAIREHAPAARILIGGSAFDGSPALWEQLGADGFAGRVEDAVEVGTRLVDR